MTPKRTNSATILIVAAILCSFTPLYSQDVLDGIYMPEKTQFYSPDQQNREIFTHFSIDQDFPVESTRLIDEAAIATYTHFPEAPFKQEDCVFFNPVDAFLGTTSDKNVHHPLGFHFGEFNSKEFNFRDGNPILPNSLRFYVDTTFVSLDENQIQLVLDPDYSIPLDAYLQPFYFRKYEVSNAEYREFVHYVRDSLARTLLFEEYSDDFGFLKPGGQEFGLNWKKEIDWKDPIIKEVTAILRIPEFEHFRGHRGFDGRRFDYHWGRTPEGWDHPYINIEPDTSCWINDFDYSYNGPMTAMYFHHPAYNHYPVVGVNYYQVLAFLEWKTKMHQQALNKKGIALRVEYRLPTEAEWDMAATSVVIDKEAEVFTKSYYQYSESDWITNLHLTETDRVSKDLHLDSLTNMQYISSRRNVLDQQMRDPITYSNGQGIDFTADESFHTRPTVIDQPRWVKKQRQINRDDNGICYLGGNVSEWLDASYADQWKPMFEKRQAQLQGLNAKDAEIQGEIERYFDAQNDDNGKLIRGSNWYDERYSYKMGKNVAGTNAKTFQHPYSAHATLGFRYVIHVYPKE